MSFHGRFSPENKALKNAANGYAGLDGSSKLTVGQLPLATGAAAGAVIVGTNLTVTAGTLSLSNANVLAAIGFTPAGLTGNTFTGTQVTPAATTALASLRIPHGAAPTTPTNGDVWSTTAALFVRLNGATATLAQLGAQSFTGLQTFSAGLTVSAGTITLPATSIADAALSLNVVLKNGANVFTASTNQFIGIKALDPAAPTYGLQIHMTSVGSYARGMRFTNANNAAGADVSMAEFGILGSGGVLSRAVLGFGLSGANPLAYNGTQWFNMFPSGNVNVGSQTTDQGFLLFVNGTAKVNTALTVGNGFTVTAGTVSLPAGSVGDAALTSNVPLKNGTNVYTGSNEFQGLIKQGDGNQDILEKKSAEIETHDRNTVTAVSANIITSITERDGVTVVKTTTFSYLGSGNLNTIVIVAGGKTTTVTYSYDGNGNFTGTTRTVV